MAKVYEQDLDEADYPDNPEPELENHLTNDSYPMQLKTSWQQMAITQPGAE